MQTKWPLYQEDQLFEVGVAEEKKEREGGGERSGGIQGLVSFEEEKEQFNEFVF